MGNPALEVVGLSIDITIPAGTFTVVSDVSFQVEEGRTLGIVGESGSGKSLSCLAIVGLLPPNATKSAGEIMLNGEGISGLSRKDLRRIRGGGIAMIFQDYSEALNPVKRIGGQISEVLRLHAGMNRAAAEQRGIELLKLVEIPEPAQRWKDYPHQLSGGMSQRIMIAMAIAGSPSILIADEPTTALDVTTQAQILDLIMELKDMFGMTTVMVSHDLGVIAETADDVVVMYAGRVIERGTVYDIFERPRHPYTHGLLASRPTFDSRIEHLIPIPGSVPAIDEYPSGCRFAPRCTSATDHCRSSQPDLTTVGEQHFVECFHPVEVDRG